MAVRITEVSPGPSEFNHGSGLMPPLTQGYVPKPVDQLRALHRLNQDPTNIDASAQLDYTDDIKEK